MTSSLDVSLDDLIKKNKKAAAAASGGGRGRGRGSSGPARRFPNRSGNRDGPYSMGKAPHDMHANQTGGHLAPAARVSAIKTGTKLYISNLDYGVTIEDINEVFSEVGDIKHSSLHYDRSGRSKGTAEVVFSRQVDALAAIKRYDNVQLDGRPMKIEIIGTNIETPAAVPPITNMPFGSLDSFPRSSALGRGVSTRWPQGGGSRGGARGHGEGRGRGNQISAADLDADLEKYHAEAMQIK